MNPEFSRPIDIRNIDESPITLTASADECSALARRFDLVAIRALAATVSLTAGKNGVIDANGRLVADVVQSCAVSAEDLPVQIDDPIAFRFVPESRAHQPDEEIELDEDDCDEIEYSGTRFDLGEAVAQSLVLALDPFATGPEADATRASGLVDDRPANPFAALARLKNQQE